MHTHARTHARTHSRTHARTPARARARAPGRARAGGPRGGRFFCARSRAGPAAARPGPRAPRGNRPIARAQVYDKTGKGQIDMADFSKLLGLLKDGRATGDLEKELTKLHVNDEGKIGYFEFIQWWCREDDSI